MQTLSQCASCAAEGRGGEALLCQRPYWAPPPPQNLAWATRPHARGKSTHPGGASNKWHRAQRLQSPRAVKEGAYKRGRAEPPPPPPPKGHACGCMERHGTDVQGRRSHKPPHPRGSDPGEALSCDLDRRQTGVPTGPQAECGPIIHTGATCDHGGPRPMRVSLFIVVLPSGTTTHTHMQSMTTPHSFWDAMGNSSVIFSVPVAHVDRVPLCRQWAIHEAPQSPSNCRTPSYFSGHTLNTHLIV